MMPTSRLRSPLLNWNRLEKSMWNIIPLKTKSIDGRCTILNIWVLIHLLDYRVQFDIEYIFVGVQWRTCPQCTGQHYRSKKISSEVSNTLLNVVMNWRKQKHSRANDRANIWCDARISWIPILSSGIFWKIIEQTESLLWKFTAKNQWGIHRLGNLLVLQFKTRWKTLINFMSLFS